MNFKHGLHFSVILSALTLAACANHTPTPDAVAEIAVPKVEHTIIHYQCQPDNRDIEMRYFPVHGVAVLVLDGTTHELQQQVSGSGFWYSNGKYTVRGKGDSLWLEIGRMMPIDCQAKAQ